MLAAQHTSESPHSHILVRIAHFARLTRQLQNQRLFHLGLEFGQAAVLRLVIDNPGITQARVRQLLDLDKSTVSRIVRLLEKCRMLRKRKCLDGGKSPALWSTDLSEWLVTMFREVDEDVVEDLFAGFRDEEFEVFTALLRRATTNVSHVLHSPPDPRPPWLRQPGLRMKGF
jgi:DNA-binding MarR family transcriptional regulator